jgi:hypothetical protein
MTQTHNLSLELNRNGPILKIILLLKVFILPDQLFTHNTYVCTVLIYVKIITLDVFITNKIFLLYVLNKMLTNINQRFFTKIILAVFIFY